MIDNFGFIAWNEHTIQQMAINRDYTDFVECYTDTTTILEEFLNDERIEKLYDGTVGFNAHDDYQRTKQL